MWQILNLKVPEISVVSTSIQNVNITSKRTSKVAATAIISHLPQGSNSENIGIWKFSWSRNSWFAENLDLPLRFANESELFNLSFSNPYSRGSRLESQSKVSFKVVNSGNFPGSVQSVIFYHFFSLRIPMIKLMQ